MCDEALSGLAEETVIDHCVTKDATHVEFGNATALFGEFCIGNVAVAGDFGCDGPAGDGL